MASLQFSWSDTNTASNITYRLYENSTEIVRDIAVLNFTLLMDDKPQGVYIYDVTAFDESTRLESVPSDSVSINFILPNAPIGLSVGWE